MNKIAERIVEILKMLQEELGDRAFVDRCYDPLVYMQSLTTNKRPLVLLSYTGSIYNTNSKLYPCNSSFVIYFADIKKDGDKLLDLMQDVYNFFNLNAVKTTDNEKVKGQKLIYQDQNFHAESKEHVIFSQGYKLLIT